MIDSPLMQTLDPEVGSRCRVEGYPLRLAGLESVDLWVVTDALADFDRFVVMERRTGGRFCDVGASPFRTCEDAERGFKQLVEDFGVPAIKAEVRRELKERGL